MRFIGDVHGKFRPYKRIIKDCAESIQIGDMGVGFRSFPHGEEHGNPPHYAMVPGHRFIRGNHDNPGSCRGHSQWIPDGTIEGDMMFIGGAVSIDKAYRVEGYSWWPDEELSYAELDTLVGKYQDAKPRIMVTHDCPEEVAKAVCYHHNMGKMNDGSCTRQALQAMLSCHSPELWIFGHWHVSIDFTANGTRFICLNELEYKDIELGPPTGDNPVSPG
jgi:hypothetical protein